MLQALPEPNGHRLGHQQMRDGRLHVHHRRMRSMRESTLDAIDSLTF